MLTLPDFREKQILFIDIRSYEGETKIKFQNDNLVFLKDGQIINRASCYKIFCVFIIGEITITSGLIKKGLSYGVSFFFLTSNFNVYAEIGAKGEANFLLRQQQYKLSKKKELEISRFLVLNKVKNQFRLLKKQIPKEIKVKIQNSKNIDSLRGIEGNVSKIFFKKYFQEIVWYRREPRTKVDINNLLLDIGYTQIFNFIDSILRLYGFDTYKGIYHQLFFARKSLSCDIQEPFRCIIDKALLKAYNLGQVKKNDFEFKNGKFLLSWNNSFHYSKIFSKAIMERKEEIYVFIQNFYRHLMLPEKNKLQKFNINKKYDILSVQEKRQTEKYKKILKKEQELKEKDIPF